MMTEVEAIELLGGPLDGLNLVIPGPRRYVRFPVLNLENCRAPIDPTLPPTFEEIVYERSTDRPHRYVWKYT